LEQADASLAAAGLAIRIRDEDAATGIQYLALRAGPERNERDNDGQKQEEDQDQQERAAQTGAPRFILHQTGV
jgi:hypothetical protein